MTVWLFGCFLPSLFPEWSSFSSVCSVAAWVTVFTSLVRSSSVTVTAVKTSISFLNLENNPRRRDASTTSSCRADGSVPALPGCRADLISAGCLMKVDAAQLRVKSLPTCVWLYTSQISFERRWNHLTPSHKCLKWVSRNEAASLWTTVWDSTVWDSTVFSCSWKQLQLTTHRLCTDAVLTLVPVWESTTQTKCEICPEVKSFWSRWPPDAPDGRFLLV